jgi:hypothetical protein
LENLQRINAEIERIAQLEKNVTTQTVATADAVETVADKTKARAEAAEHIRELALQIKEAENAGNAELAASLQYQKDYEDALMANAESEDQYGRAVREANANLEARNKLLADAAAKTQALVAEELAYVEAMAYGTDEQKAQAEWMKDYNDSKKRGFSEDQAQRDANAKSFSRASSTTSGSGSRGESGKTETAYQINIRNLQQSPFAKSNADSMKIEDQEARDMQRAAGYRSAGNYDAAARLEKRAKDRSDRSAQKAAFNESARSRGFNNADEAYSKQRDPFDSFFGTKDAETKRRKAWDESQKSMPSEGMTEDEKKKGKDGAGGKGKDGQGDLTSTVKSIYDWMTKNLPANALSD